MVSKERPVIGLEQSVTVFGQDKKRKLKARVDTGAGKSSIDIKLAERLGIGPVIKEKVIRNAHGKEVRQVVRLTIDIAGKELSAQFTLADRKELKYSVLIGRNILKKGNFLIDPKK